MDDISHQRRFLKLPCEGACVSVDARPAFKSSELDYHHHYQIHHVLQRTRSPTSRPRNALLISSLLSPRFPSIQMSTLSRHSGLLLGAFPSTLYYRTRSSGPCSTKLPSVQCSRGNSSRRGPELAHGETHQPFL
jgi:hypothetical protein